jgi:hypothetical protein
VTEIRLSLSDFGKRKWFHSSPAKSVASIHVYPHREYGTFRNVRTLESLQFVVEKMKSTTQG